MLAYTRDETKDATSYLAVEDHRVDQQKASLVI